MGDKLEVRVERPPNGAALVPPSGPPDGGFRAWLVAVASLLCNGIIFGILNSGGVICDFMQGQLTEQGDKDAAAKASLVQSLAIGFTFFTSAIAGVLGDNLGIRKTALFGSVLATAGMLASSFLAESVGALYFTLGIMFGVGASLTYNPSLVILGHYFKTYLGIVNGFVTAGSSVFTLVMPHALDYIIINAGLKGGFLFLTGLTSILIGCAMTFKTLIPRKRQSLPGKSQIGSLVNTALFRRPRYVVWAIAMPVALLGYFVPYVHIVKFVKVNYPEGDGKLLISCIAFMSLISRLIIGKLADMPRVSSSVLQQLSFAILGVLTMLLVVVKNWTLMIVLALGMGICDGAFVSLIGPIAFHLCGQEGASQAIGFVLGLSSIPMTVGPALAGVFFDKTGSYTVSFLSAGACTALGAVIVCFMRCVRSDAVADTSKPSPDAIEFEVMKPLYDTTLQDTRPLPPSYKEAITGVYIISVNSPMAPPQQRDRDRGVYEYYEEALECTADGKIAVVVPLYLE